MPTFNSPPPLISARVAASSITMQPSDGLPAAHVVPSPPDPYIDTHIRTHKYKHTYMHTNIHAYTHTLHAHIHTYIHAYNRCFRE